MHGNLNQCLFLLHTIIVCITVQGHVLSIFAEKFPMGCTPYSKYFHIPLTVQNSVPHKAAFLTLKFSELLRTHISGNLFRVKKQLISKLRDILP